MEHEWQFGIGQVGSQDTGFAPVVVTTCSRCGVVRMHQVPMVGMQGRASLTGICQPPATSSVYDEPGAQDG